MRGYLMVFYFATNFFATKFIPKFRRAIMVTFYNDGTEGTFSERTLERAVEKTWFVMSRDSISHD